MNCRYYGDNDQLVLVQPSFESARSIPGKGVLQYLSLLGRTKTSSKLYGLDLTGLEASTRILTWITFKRGWTYPKYSVAATFPCKEVNDEEKEIRLQSKHPK